MQFLHFKMAAIYQGQGNLRLYIFQDKVHLTPSKAPTEFHWNNLNRFGEKYKNATFSTEKSCGILSNCANCALHFGTTQNMCPQNMIGISVILRMLDPGQRFRYTFWILRWWQHQRLQRYQNHIHVGPTLHVGTCYAIYVI